MGTEGTQRQKLDQRIPAVNTLKGAKAEGKDSAGTQCLALFHPPGLHGAFPCQEVLHSEHAPSVSLHCPLLCPFLSHQFPLFPLRSFISASMFAYNK